MTSDEQRDSYYDEALKNMGPEPRRLRKKHQRGLSKQARKERARSCRIYCGARRMLKIIKASPVCDIPFGDD